SRYERGVKLFSERAAGSTRRFRLQFEAAALLGLPAPPLPPTVSPGSLGLDNMVADLLRRRRDLDERAAASPNQRWERGNLATDSYRLAVALRDVRQLRDAEAAGRQAFERFLPLAREEPREVRTSYDVGRAAHLLADMALKSGRFEEALPL